MCNLHDRLRVYMRRSTKHVNNAKGDRTVTAIKQSKEKKVVTHAYLQEYKRTKRVTDRPAVRLQGAEIFFFHSRRFESATNRRRDSLTDKNTGPSHDVIG